MRQIGKLFKMVGKKNKNKWHIYLGIRRQKTKQRVEMERDV